MKKTILVLGITLAILVIAATFRLGALDKNPAPSKQTRPQRT